MIDRLPININADVGEGAGNDASVIPYLYSCNISCGAHAGNTETIKNAISIAVENNVRIGAHPGYPDPENFGRVRLNLSKEALHNTLSEQLYQFKKLCDEAGGQIHHVKFHGALYNESARDEQLSRTLIEHLIELNVAHHFYAPHQSVFAKLAEPHFKVSYEAFLDRAYEADGSLRSRKKNDALLLEPKQVVQQLEQLVHQSSVTTINGEIIPVRADTFCIHGDHPNILSVLNSIQKQFKL